MAIRYSRSATRHGVIHERSRDAVENCACPLYSSDPGDEDLVVFLGPDRPTGGWWSVRKGKNKRRARPI